MPQSFAAPPALLSPLSLLALQLVAPGRGILAADESTGTIGKRELLFTAIRAPTPLSAAILFEETLFQKTADGTPFVKLLEDRGVVGTVPIPATHDELTTTGLDGLAERCRKYKAAGARFAKWRSVLKISTSLHLPSPLAVDENAHVLARYAAEDGPWAWREETRNKAPTRDDQETLRNPIGSHGLVRAPCSVLRTLDEDEDEDDRSHRIFGVAGTANGLVPIIEPEILMDGDHDLEAAMDATERVLSAVYKKLVEHHVYLEGTVLKPNMVCPGQSCPTTYTPSQIAEATLTVLLRTVPAAVPGITFLSGGQSELSATLHLDAINKAARQLCGGRGAPWRLTFSYGRALQAGAMSVWRGKPENVERAQEVFWERCRANGEASLGRFVKEGEQDGVDGGKITEVRKSSVEKVRL
ncbi:hypothetical protein HDU93_008232 [Gonapodya sp. JEL0774]|nr:hypothetical protein HDU93_008232 [Gonapodya sp. JEL0774]